MSTITTHILDTSQGKPATGVHVALEMQNADETWRLVSAGVTDDGGRLKFVFPPGFVLAKGAYRLVFETSAYFRAQNSEGLYPTVTIHFAVRDPAQHFHLPLLLAPHGYSTYRGS